MLLPHLHTSVLTPTSFPPTDADRAELFFASDNLDFMVFSVGKKKLYFSRFQPFDTLASTLTISSYVVR